MTNVVVSIASIAAVPTRLVGSVVKNKDGSFSITYREPGQVKTITKSFLASEVVGALAGDAGFVIAMTNTPITKVVGELVIKEGVRYVKTENGTVQLNNIPGVAYDVKEVEADSKEARAAERAAKVKVRPIKKAEEKSAKGSSKAERRAARAEKTAKSEKSAKAGKEVAKKKKNR